MDFSKLKKLTIDGIDLKSLAINGIQVWKSGPKNWVKYSTESDGVTIYNNGLGYKDACRIRSGGLEGESPYASCTGFIPLKAGDTLRIWPPFTGLNATNAINFADGAFSNLGQSNDNGSAYGICQTDKQIYMTELVDGVSALTLSDQHDSNIRYVRVTNQTRNASADNPSVIKTGADMIVTVNEEIDL